MAPRGIGRQLRGSQHELAEVRAGADRWRHPVSQESNDPTFSYFLISMNILPLLLAIPFMLNFMIVPAYREFMDLVLAEPDSESDEETTFWDNSGQGAGEAGAG